MLSVLAGRPALRVGVIAAYVLLVEWSRALASTAPHAATAALFLGGVALVLSGAGWPLDRLGIGRSRLAFRILGGGALAVGVFLPAPARPGLVPIPPPFLAFPAIVGSIGQGNGF